MNFNLSYFLYFLNIRSFSLGVNIVYSLGSHKRRQHHTWTIPSGANGKKLVPILTYSRQLAPLSCILGHDTTTNPVNMLSFYNVCTSDVCWTLWAYFAKNMSTSTCGKYKTFQKSYVHWMAKNWFYSIIITRWVGFESVRP